jgi:hypothetical protein
MILAPLTYVYITAIQQTKGLSHFEHTSHISNTCILDKAEIDVLKSSNS